jgi:type I restriction enzyme S subunit
MSWRKVKLGDILTESKIISENPNPDRRIKVRLKVLGVEKRGLENEVEGATKQYIRKAGQFIYGKQNFHKGAFGIVPPELDGYESSSDLPSFDIDKSCLPEFIFYFFKQGNFYLELSKIASGVATQRINTSQMFELEVLLPDIKTQKELISNIQLLEKNGGEISTELTHQLTLVKKLRQQLLQDAVKGNLVEQNKKDEPAIELLKKIKAEKQKLIAEKKLKKEKELPPIKPEEIPFEIPENWVWCRLNDICEAIIDCPHSTPHYIENETGYYGIDTNCINEKGVITRLRSLSFESYQERIRRLVPKENDIIYAREGSIGLATFIPKDKNICLGQRVMLFRASKAIIHNYLIYAVTDVGYKNRLLAKHRGMGAKHVNVKDIVESLIALPPLAEQNRIVQKIDEFMQYCNELEESIKQSESQNEKLLQQVLREALRKEPVGV